MAIRVKPLTTKEVDTAKPREKDYSLTDGGGMYLLVKNNGSKVWRFQYYRPVSKKRALISLGAYPEISLAAARKIRENYRTLLAQQIDPQDHNQQQVNQKLFEQNRTFYSMAQDWFKLRENEVKNNQLKKVTHEDSRDRVNNHLMPLFGNLSVRDITAPLAIQKLKPLEKQGKLDTLERVIGYLNNIMTLAVNHGILQYNPVADIGKVFIKPVKQNNPTIPPEQLPTLFNALQQAKISIETRCALEFLLLTAARVGTVTRAEWSEINWDEKLWEIPKEKLKGRIGKVYDFVLPLSNQAIQSLKIMQRLNGHSKYIFPSIKAPQKFMNPETPNKALQRMGYRNILTAHGIRSIFSTKMNDSEFNPEIIEVCLAHFEYSSVRGTYNKAKYLEQRKAYMQWWADFVEQQSSGTALFCL